MIGRGFRLGLYGHQHKAQVIGHHVWLSNQEKMAVVSAGSLCAGGRELPTGIYRQYSIIEIAADYQNVRVHVREMRVANLFSPALMPDFGGKSFVDLDWTLPRNMAGTIINIEAIRKRRIIEDAELEAKTGDAMRAISLLNQLSLPGGSYERELLLTTAMEAQDWTTIIKVTDPPLTITELINRIEALNQLNQSAIALNALDHFSKTLQLPESIEADLRRRVTTQEIIKR